MNPPEAFDSNIIARHGVIAVADVTIEERQREVDPEHVDRIAESFSIFKSQLQPIIVTHDGVLIDGAHRLAAAKKNGLTHLDALWAVEGVNMQQRRLLEAEANRARKELSPMELKQLWDTLYPSLEAEATARKAKAAAYGAQKTATTTPTNAVTERIGTKQTKVRDMASEAVGLSGSSIEKIDKIEQWAVDSSLTPEVRKVAETALAKLHEPGSKVESEFTRVSKVVDLTTVRPEESQKHLAINTITHCVSLITAAEQQLINQTSKVKEAFTNHPETREDWQGVIASVERIQALVVDLGAVR